MQVSSNNSWISPAMMSSPGVAPGETTTGSGNVGSNDGARNAVGLFHVVVVSGVLQKLGRAMKGDHGEPHVPRLGLSVYFKEDGQAENQRLGCLGAARRDGTVAVCMIRRRPKGGSKRREYNTDGRPRERARHHRGAERLLKIPAEPSPELRIPGAAAQTRVVSPGRNSDGFPHICATFQRDNLGRHF